MPWRSLGSFLQGGLAKAGRPRVSFESLGPRIGLAGHFFGLLLALLNDEVGRMALDDALDLQHLMPRDDREASRLGPDRLVLGQGRRDRLRAVGGAALANEADRRLNLNLEELLGHFGHTLVDLAIERLVAGETLLSFPHGEIVPIRPSAGKGSTPSEWACALKLQRMGVSSDMPPEDVFREANEEIAEKARELELQQPIPFLCECSDKRCFAHVFLTLEQYADARSDPQRYLTIAGHEVVGAMVIAKHDRFALAEKI